jgi:hypothetical protein
VSSEIARGLDILDLETSAFISPDELTTAKTVHDDYLNVQDQPKMVWLAALAKQLHTDAASATDAPKAHKLAFSVGDLAKAP